MTEDLHGKINMTKSTICLVTNFPSSLQVLVFQMNLSPALVRYAPKGRQRRWIKFLGRKEAKPRNIQINDLVFQEENSV